MQCLILTVVIIEWVVVGYSLAFTTGDDKIDFFIGFDKIFLNGIGWSIIRVIQFWCCLCHFGNVCCNNPALIIGAFRTNKI